MTEKFPADVLALKVLEASAVGVMMPPRATEVCTPAEVKVKDASVVNAGTEVGGMTPSPPTTILVDEPEM